MITMSNLVTAIRAGAVIYEQVNRWKTSEQQNKLDNRVANLHKVTDNLNNITVQLNKSTQELQSLHGLFPCFGDTTKRMSLVRAI
ncbi:hypothetical protein Pyn_20496 [Prunus yedoensis var. nudiflora]|uniref:Uncharacterized protein n=1 Tax=Prunus yedoensis var. nudiflora TaxID=2094558 RepID=A0A314Z7P6_PRUYE|nr:hypothetical protein Pyn_20496 [Prunus yedoensis var. nudiflora]